MLSPVSKKLETQAPPTFLNITLKGINGSFITQSTLSSYAFCGGYILSNAWEWIKTHIFCCSPKSSEETIETLDTIESTEEIDLCPIPLLSEGEWIDLELNQEIRNLYFVEIQNHPEWASFPKELSLFYQKIHEELNSTEFTTNDPLVALNYHQRAENIRYLPEVIEAMNPHFSFPHEISSLEIDNIPFMTQFDRIARLFFVKIALIRHARNHQEAV